ncbi:MAG: hypothetical protein RL307_1205 [Pseudomonadota bacterium]
MTDVLCLTLNPALDVLTTLDEVRPVDKLRCGPVLNHPGGGGVNVARVLHRLGVNVVSCHLSGGVSGAHHTQLLDQEGVQHHIIPIEANMHQSFSVHELKSAQDYRFVLPGPSVQTSEWLACRDWVCSHLPNRVLVLSGGAAPGIPDDAYAQLIRAARAKGIPVVLDSHGPLLRQALAEGVLLYKPNEKELAELCGQRLSNDHEIVQAARSLVLAGQAQWVAVSLAERGAIWVGAESAWQSPSVKVSPRTTIGAGDSFVAGAVWAWLQAGAPADCLRSAMAAGSAALLNPGTALCEAHDVRTLLPQVSVQTWP